MKSIKDFISDFGCATIIVIFILITIGTCVHDSIEERKERKERIAHRKHLNDSLDAARRQDSIYNILLKDSINSLPASAQIGEFLYKDKGGCLHKTSHCFQVELSSTSELISCDYGELSVSHLGFSYSFHRIHVSELKEEDLYYCCSSCIDDKIYKYLLKLIKNPKKPNPMDDNNIPPSRHLTTNSFLQGSEGNVFQ